MHKHMSDFILKTIDTTDLLFIQLIKYSFILNTFFKLKVIEFALIN